MGFKLIRWCLKRAYLIGKSEAEKSNFLQKRKDLNGKIVIGENSVISDEALIQNDTGICDMIKVGSNTLVRGYLLVYNHGGKISIGDDSFIGPQCKIWSAKNIYIGDRVLISHNVNIHDNNSHPLDSLQRHMDFVHIFKQGLQKTIDLSEREILIEDDVWIGFNATILKGVKIGRGAIVGANCIVTKDVPPYAIVVNNVSTEIIRYTT